MVADGGKILITVPAYQWLWSKHDEFLHHKRRYSARDLQHKIDIAGLRVEKLSFFNTLLFPLAVTARFKDRLLGAASASGSEIPADPVNALLYQIFSAERYLLERLSLPFGVSLLAILRPE